MHLDARVYKAANDLERLMYEMAHREIDENVRTFFGEPPSLDKNKQNYKPGKRPNINALKKLYQNYLLY